MIKTGYPLSHWCLSCQTIFLKRAEFEVNEVVFWGSKNRFVVARWAENRAKVAQIRRMKGWVGRGLKWSGAGAGNAGYYWSGMR